MTAQTLEAKTMEELENPEKQERLRKWLPYLWLPPVGLIVIMFLVAFFAR
jgi:hypothetical protein